MLVETIRLRPIDGSGNASHSQLPGAEVPEELFPPRSLFEDDESAGQSAMTGEQLSVTTSRKLKPIEHEYSVDLSEIIKWQLGQLLQPQPRFVSLQRWEGYVVELKGDTFIARLADLDRSDAFEEQAEIDIREIREDDRSLLRLGGSFYWTIGYRAAVSGQRERVSIIRFRRLPDFTEEDIARAQAEAEQAIERIGWY